MVFSFSADISANFAAQLADIIFKTLPIYDDRQSMQAVDDLIIEVLVESPFMKSFAALLVLSMEKQVKSYSPVGSYKLLRWSCILLRCSHFISASKNAFSRLVSAQASLLQVLMRGSFRLGRASKKLLFHLFSKVIISPFHIVHSCFYHVMEVKFIYSYISV